MPIKLAKKLANKKSNLSSPVKVYKGLKNSSWGKKEWVRLTTFLLVCGGIGYLTFSTFAASTVAHPDGSLIQFGANPSIYMIQGGQKRGITSEDAFNSNHYSWGMIVQGNASDAALPAGPNIGIRAGTLVMTPGNPTVWVIYDGGNGNYNKWGIPSPAVFDSLGYSYNQVLTVPPGELPPDSPYLITGANHAGGQFVQGADGIVYMVGATGKYRVADPSVLGTYNFALYRAVPGDETLPILGFLPFHEGSLVEGTGGLSVYMIGCSNAAGAQAVCAMQKHGFTDEETFYSLGYNFSEVLTTPQGNVDGITTGSNVSLPKPCLPNNPLCTPAGTSNPTPAPTPTPTPTPKPTPTPPSTTCLPKNPLCTPANPPAPPPTTPTCLPRNPLCTPANPTPPPSGPVGTSPPPTTPTCLPRNPLCTPNSNYQFPGGSIDKPSAGQKVSGHNVVISGWAVDKETYISDIKVTIEGHAAVGVMTRNIDRSDVCASSKYVGRPGCPKIGWSFSWNSASVPNGNYEIEVKITDSDPGNYQSTTLTRQVTTNNPLPPSGEINSPKAKAELSGVVTIQGWAMDNYANAETPISSVMISVNGSFVGNASYGYETATTDQVCKNYPGRPGCPKIGWRFQLDTGQYQKGLVLNVKATITDSDNPAATTTIGVTYSVSWNQSQNKCPDGQTGTPPNCKVPPTTSGGGANQVMQVVYAYTADMNGPNTSEVKNIPVGINTFQSFLKKSTTGVISSAPNGIEVSLSPDIKTYQLPRTVSQYEAAAGMKADHSVWLAAPMDDLVKADLAKKFSGDNGKKYLVYVDGAFQDFVCGYGGGSYAAWYLTAVQWGDPKNNEASVPCEQRGSNKYVGGPMPNSYFQNLGPLHEIFHTMNVALPCMPHFDKDNTGHVTEKNDLMYYLMSSPNMFVDANHDDYYGPNLSKDCAGITDPDYAVYFNKL